MIHPIIVEIYSALLTGVNAYAKNIDGESVPIYMTDKGVITICVTWTESINGSFSRFTSMPYKPLMFKHPIMYVVFNTMNGNISCSKT